ncbi:MAG: hypothetical protein HYZ50_00625 [Deltaproteobacteria bacterium]|nr:hypothetical protein [Deltaproteobacteria bacterium]
MEIYFSFWTFVMFAFNVLLVTLVFGLTLRAHRQVLEELKQQAAHQDTVWQKLFAKAENTERLSQEILTRLANERQPH